MKRVENKLKNIFLAINKQQMRKRQAKKRPLLPDPRFNDQLVTRFVNNMMWDGKKSVAFKVFYDAIDIVDEKKQDDEKLCWSFGKMHFPILCLT